MISKKTLGAVSIAALMGLAACSSNDKANTASSAPPPPPPLSAQDTAFINSTAQSGTEEINGAQLAETNSNSARVKMYAQKMVTDHTAADQKLASIAQAKGVTPNMTADDAHQQMMSQLQNEHGRTFDRDYIKGQVADHQAMIQVLQTEIQTGTDPDLKSYASSTLPIIQQHLQMAEALETHGSSTHHHMRMHHHHVTTSS